MCFIAYVAQIHPTTRLGKPHRKATQTYAVQSPVTMCLVKCNPPEWTPQDLHLLLPPLCGHTCIHITFQSPEGPQITGWGENSTCCPPTRRATSLNCWVSCSTRPRAELPTCFMLHALRQCSGEEIDQINYFGAKY